MDKLNLPKFYVGQKVVALDYFIDGAKKGKIYTVKNNRVAKCGCRIIDIGIKTHYDEINCNIHNSHEASFGIGWHNQIYFSPIQEANPPLMTFTEIKDKEKQEILILN